MARIEFQNVTKVFPDGTKAVDALDLEIPDGGFTVLVGPSGSGKSTALRVLAGLEDPTSGEIRIGDRDVTDLPPKDRDIAMVFQNYALYPHMSVAENMGFGLKLGGVSKADVRRRVADVARRLGIEHLLGRRPKTLSGGQRQRVALGRAIVRDPQAFLMDEPLSNLDAKLRVEMRAYISQLHQELRTTTVYVTHDQTEAMTMGDCVAVMRDGRLEQLAPPGELYAQPANLFVASFMGSPAMNILRGRLDRSAGGMRIQLGEQSLELPDGALARWPTLADASGLEVAIGIRPEGVRPVSDAGGPGVLSVEVFLVEALGADVLVHTRPGATTIDVGRPDDDIAGEAGQFVARVPPGTPVSAGGRLHLAVDLGRMHLFDVATGASLPVGGASMPAPAPPEIAA